MVKFNSVILSSNYNALLTQFLLFPEAGQLLTLAIMYCLCWFSYFTCSLNGFVLHIRSMGNHIIIWPAVAQITSAPLISFPHCLVFASQGLRTDCHLLYHISLGYNTCSAFWLIQWSLWGHSRCHLLLHHHGISFCLSLLCECSHKLMKFVLVPVITFCQKHVVIGKALLWFKGESS